MIQELFTGIVIGIIFSSFGLSIPAPSNISGILGIVGIFVGFLIINWFKK